jgi:hypothetical protein
VSALPAEDDRDPARCVLCDEAKEVLRACPVGCGPVCPDCRTLHVVSVLHVQTREDGRGDYLYDQHVDEGKWPWRKGD